MPAGFDNCVKQGGKVRTVTGPHKKMEYPQEAMFMSAFLKVKVHRGEVKQKQKK